ncbi:MAG: tRNA (adenosine(37)-N6)-threonylcarbamoyltransferase complex transferase subunit TsaD [Eubacterium sp.]|nr:tRNA (adenosine(37)-N6)-threonylcarbamoyltransferase complex transferase subunit TsaD [Eubacterium sp.]
MVKILGIETSCDETAVAVVEDGRRVISNVIYTQIPTHTLYGGVVPEIASREHVLKINQVIKKALEEAKLTWEDIDAIAVTYGPGLVGPLLIGVSTAKAIAYAKNIPLVGVNHIEGHISANYLSDNLFFDDKTVGERFFDQKMPEEGLLYTKPPYMCLVASGGHSHIVRVDGYTEYTIIGKTHDDAAGEAFDKVARAIGLGYPGGPKVDKLAREGNPHAIEFPRASVGDSPYDFSFSGIKSAVLNYLNGAQMKGQEVNKADVAASFQQAVIDVLADHTIKAALDYNMDMVALAGGVAANSLLRETMEKRAKAKGLKFRCPKLIYCTDNGAMIAAAGYHEFMAGRRADLYLNAVPNLKIGQR